jgi:hypothetical protein
MDQLSHTSFTKLSGVSSRGYTRCARTTVALTHEDQRQHSQFGCSDNMVKMAVAHAVVGQIDSPHDYVSTGPHHEFCGRSNVKSFALFLPMLPTIVSLKIKNLYARARFRSCERMR